jgi:hypothetical protein
VAPTTLVHRPNSGKPRSRDSRPRLGSPPRLTDSFAEGKKVPDQLLRSSKWVAFV